jgi:hypothetical protein
MNETTELSVDFANNAFNNIMALYFQPEIERRQAQQLIPNPFDLLAAQAIIFPDGRPPLIRFNNEVSADLKLKPGTDTTIENFWPSRQDILGVKLKEGEFENCGHITMIRLADTFQLTFDFIYNKKDGADNLKAASEFLATAKFALDNNLTAAFIDNAFSACELLAKTNLLLETNKQVMGKTTHKAIKTAFNIRHRNSTDDFELSVRETLNQLSDMRNSARYLNGTANPEKLNFEQTLGILEKLYTDLLARVGD